MNNYESYEDECKKIREENKSLLNDFENWMLKKGLSRSLVKRHSNDTEFFINEFLLHETPKRAVEGIEDINLFLGYWFIRKAMWSSKSSIKSNAATLKKFYTYMKERGDIDAASLKDLKQTIKEGLPEWVATIERYADESVDIEDVW